MSSIRNNSSTIDVSQLLAELAPRIDQALKGGFDIVFARAPERLKEASHYALFGGGKRLRPALTLLACDACNGDMASAQAAACALEMIHTYSLVHDDLPAMDDDDLRRGRPTTHKAFDEATAILVGDALQTGAFEVLASSGYSADVCAALVKSLSAGAGAIGMVGGQQLDIDTTTDSKDAQRELLDQIQLTKTAALLAAACACGAIVAGTDQQQTQKLHEYGIAIGRAFQIVDDVLDVTSSAEVLGKTVGKDAAQDKLTYPSLIGLEASRKEAQKLVDHAKALIADLPRPEKLAAIADFIVARKS